MPRRKQNSPIPMTARDRSMLEQTSKSRTEPLRRVERAIILLHYADGLSITEIARAMGTDRMKVARRVKRARDLGVMGAMHDFPRTGRPRLVTDEARAWAHAQAAIKPRFWGYSGESWTHSMFVKHIADHCAEAGFPILGRLSRLTLIKLLKSSGFGPPPVVRQPSNRARRKPLVLPGAEQ
ncbi:MAG: helix-turn-helix domain-containing protein [Polyangiaceae bacterium]|nr:helix-turn-helix domain-containing protein [Polyangiaceae bacterium]